MRSLYCSENTKGDDVGDGIGTGVAIENGIEDADQNPTAITTPIPIPTPNTFVRMAALQAYERLSLQSVARRREPVVILSRPVTGGQ